MCRPAAVSRPAAPRHIGPVCDNVPPPLRQAGDDHSILCHIPTQDLAALQRPRSSPAGALVDQVPVGG